MFRRDPLRAALSELEGVLGRDLRPALPLLRAALRRGGVVGAARGGQVALAGVGGVPREGLFELASVTKPFTAALAGRLVREGHLAWDAPLSRLGGPLRGWPDFVTAHALATHTAGLPPHPARAVLTTLTRFQDPYGGMSAQAALASARRWANARQAGRFAYSNLGLGVLALALAHAAGEEPTAAGYGRALRRHLTGPLALESVSLTPPPAGLVAPTATLLGEGVTGFGPLAGAGGLFGTAADLLAFGAAHLDGRAEPAWREVIRPPGLPPLLGGVAPGWFHSRGLWWHDGVARGTRTALGFRPESGAVVALLARGGVPLVGVRGAVPGALLGLLGHGA
ncbi:serine hydrolase domain-containing protein [Deinococcus budaensis]|uniref:CubicO group peptidase (Beta-lactamase class C family) n=1 Tax=Deinococcus budaensis TaxID=1665626 RepID=A0A7W8LPH8_9DEIO|nr:serine hydrolase domain-containing protein [Deinococcus budaensis]MBB5233704.1 CubicO group peptidase (beta-lactamase class C family) [Deinococcus budaensis]